MSDLTDEAAEEVAAALLTPAQAMNRRRQEPNPYIAPDPQATAKDFDRFLGRIHNSYDSLTLANQESFKRRCSSILAFLCALKPVRGTSHPVAFLVSRCVNC